ncbi:hypothetical protein Y032_0762g2134 [Ancylostoma ceylanicum]|uniref:Uncharacterized protein n=1 Tax=Ancylostoma ceylanicum TaxID=53326 RepID=A0A016WDB2_9BILA|nr:hypothetical protein Y032_0762g2134 [Ancylostoma ceylanicum]
MVSGAGHGRSLTHATVLNRLSTKAHESLHVCQPVEHTVAKILNNVPQELHCPLFCKRRDKMVANPQFDYQRLNDCPAR